MVQVSAVHTGLADEPDGLADRLLERLVGGVDSEVAAVEGFARRCESASK